MSMFKSAKVNYPRKKIKVNDMKVIGVPEPDRKTKYDILLENFQIAGRKTFIERVIYIGEHCFLKYDAMVNFFTETIDSANNHRHTLEKITGTLIKYQKHFIHFLEEDEDALYQHISLLEKITGILIKYQKHFIHFLEGDEDAIYQHISLMLGNDQFGGVIENVKLLAIIHHINCRYTTEWTCMSGTPPQLLEKIDPASPIEVVGSVTYGCILKLYDILEKLNKVNSSNVDLEDKSTEENLDLSKLPDTRSSIHSTTSCARGYSFRYSKMAFENSVRAMMSKTSHGDPVMLSLPEIDTLHFLISTPHTKKLTDVFQLYSHVEQRDIYKDKVWPIAADFIPYDVYSKGYDISTVFPKPDKSDASVTVPDTADDGISVLLWEAEGEDAEM